MNEQQSFPDEANRDENIIESEAIRNITVPVIEEQIKVSKKIVETGRVQLSKQITEEEEIASIPLIHEEISVEHIPINQMVEVAPSIRYEGDTMIIPILREVAVVEKRIVLVEELRVTKKQIHTESTEKVTLRKETITVNHISNDDTKTK